MSHVLDRVNVWSRRLFDPETWWRWLRRPRWMKTETPQNITYSGEYAVWNPRTRRPLAFKGEIVEWPGLGTDVYIYDPPDCLRRHRHGPCFQLLRPGDQWFYLHWTKPAQTFKESKDYVEQMLWEALARPPLRRRRSAA